MREAVSWAETNRGWADSAGIITSVRNDNLFVANKSIVSTRSRQLLKKTIANYCNSPNEDEAALTIPRTVTLKPGAGARNSIAPRLEGYVVWFGCWRGRGKKRATYGARGLELFKRAGHCELCWCD